MWIVLLAKYPLALSDHLVRERLQALISDLLLYYTF